MHEQTDPCRVDLITKVCFEHAHGPEEFSSAHVVLFGQVHIVAQKRWQGMVRVVLAHLEQEGDKAVDVKKSRRLGK